MLFRLGMVQTGDLNLGYCSVKYFFFLVLFGLVGLFLS